MPSFLFMPHPHAKVRPALIAFTDGACSGNPGPGGWAAILLWPGERVIELAGADERTTNNRMELQAVIAALRAAAKNGAESLEICSDSQYVILGITSWILGWKKRGWKNSVGDPVSNRDLWEELDALAGSFGRPRISWRHVRGHSGHPGNERCDEIAVSFSLGRPKPLYAGPLSGYGRALPDGRV